MSDREETYEDALQRIAEQNAEYIESQALDGPWDRSRTTPHPLQIFKDPRFKCLIFKHDKSKKIG